VIQKLAAAVVVHQKAFSHALSPEHAPNSSGLPGITQEAPSPAPCAQHPQVEKMLQLSVQLGVSVDLGAAERMGRVLQHMSGVAASHLKTAEQLAAHTYLAFVSPRLRSGVTSFRRNAHACRKLAALRRRLSMQLERGESADARRGLLRGLRGWRDCVLGMSVQVAKVQQGSMRWRQSRIGRGWRGWRAAAGVA
jgi:hypothetical protein